MSTKVDNMLMERMQSALNTLTDAKSKKVEKAFQAVFNAAVQTDSKPDVIKGVQGSTKNMDSKKDNPVKESASTGKEGAASTEPQTVTKQQQKTDAAEDGTAAENTVVSEGNVITKDKALPEDVQKLVEEVCAQLGISVMDLMNQMQELVEAVSTILMEQFGITQEQLTDVLDELNLDITDLFDQTNLMNTVVKITGAEDMSAILTDEELYTQVQEIMEDMTALTEQFPVENPKKMIQELQKSFVEAEEQPVIRTDTKTPEPVAEEEQKAPVLEIETDRPQHRQEDHSAGQSMTGEQGFQQFVRNVADYAQNTVPAAESFAQQAEIEEIIRQITDTVKMQVTAETTSLEMQLHPESYGKLNLHVAVRDGLVTAKLAVENEAVRSALESQLVQLREDMNERGLKVDAVEVTIASHEFERSLEEGQENQEAPQEQNERRGHQINLQEDGMSLEEIAAMSEAEALTRRIMLENGNSIDFSA